MKWLLLQTGSGGRKPKLSAAARKVHRPAALHQRLQHKCTHKSDLVGLGLCKAPTTGLRLLRSGPSAAAVLPWGVSSFDQRWQCE